LVIGKPPVLAGGVKFTVTCAFPELTELMTGAPGTVAGVTELLDAEAGPGPLMLVAVTVKVYAVPFVSPETTIGLVADVAVNPLGLEVAL
jgi:hypothetical protein